MSNVYEQMAQIDAETDEETRTRVMAEIDALVDAARAANNAKIGAMEAVRTQIAAKPLAWFRANKVEGPYRLLNDVAKGKK